MNTSADWKYNKIEFKLASGIEVYVPLPGRINIITGNSSTGKTFLTELIDLALHSEFKEPLEDMNLKSNIVVYNGREKDKNNIDEIHNLKHHLIIIDEADAIIDKNIAEFINTDFDNQYLIIMRGYYYLSTVPTCVGKFIRNGKNISAEYDRW
jgi:hypothetical protein